MSGRRTLETISDRDLAAAVRRAPATHHVIWTGHDYDRREGSLREQALACVTEVATPVPLRDLLGRAARIEGERGFEPDLVRQGVWNHQGSKPAVYLLAERAPSGDFLAVREIPHAGSEMRSIGPGGLIMDRHGRMALAVAPGRAPPPPPLGPEEADAEPFDPSGAEDARETVARQIKARRGQREFRDKLLAAYGRRCTITGCPVLAVLEAAHIYPFRGEETNHVANGLLLRADLHTLFDCGLLAIDLDGLKIAVAPSIRGSSYGKLHGRPLRQRQTGWPEPSAEALRLRFVEFRKRHGT